MKFETRVVRHTGLAEQISFVPQYKRFFMWWDFTEIRRSVFTNSIYEVSVSFTWESEAIKYIEQYVQQAKSRKSVRKPKKAKNIVVSTKTYEI